MLGTLREVIFPRSTNEVEITFLIFSQGGGVGGKVEVVGGVFF